MPGEHWPPMRLRATDHNALDAAIHPVFNLPHSAHQGRNSLSFSASVLRETVLIY